MAGTVGLEIVEGAVMLYIAIGRNIGDKPMHSDKWREFQDDTIRAVGYPPDTIAHGGSFWKADAEETCVLVWFGIDELSEKREWNLKYAASLYDQDAIAWSVSKTQFAEAVPR